MAERVSEVMNRDVLSFQVDAPARTALDLMLTIGVTAAPVVDATDHPIGVVSIRQIAHSRADTTLAALVKSPAVVTSPNTSLHHAARLLDEADLHHLVVVDAQGGVVGFVSSLDLLRGLIGAPARHPDTFVHWDPSAAMAFSNDRMLDPEHLEDSPHAQGLVVLTRGGAGRPERVVWVETTADIKNWLVRYFSTQAELVARGVPKLVGPGLRYRYAEISDSALREETAFRMREEAQRMMNDGR